MYKSDFYVSHGNFTQRNKEKFFIKFFRQLEENSIKAGHEDIRHARTQHFGEKTTNPPGFTWLISRDSINILSTKDQTNVVQ